MIVDVTDEKLTEYLWAARKPICLFFHTPLCGTCKVAKKMLEVAVATLGDDMTVYAANLNEMPARAQAWQIESVPALLVVSPARVHECLYAFQSVEVVYRTLSNWR
jgi:thioredoxin 1